MPHRQTPLSTERARELRQRQTEAESLLWNVLRSRRLNGLKFRRQHPVDPWIGDFACLEKMLIVEIDGGYHDQTLDIDQVRQKQLEDAGFKVLRFSNEDVLADVEAVAIAISKHLGLVPAFSRKAPSPRPSPPNRFRHAK